MHLIQALARTPLRWSLECVEVLSPRNRAIPVMRMTVIPEPDAAPLSRDFQLSGSLTPESMMSLLLKEHLPANQVLRQYLESKGNVPVEMEPGAMENVSELMHTALRKLADSKQSTITWNALQHLHAADGTALWDGVREVLTEAFTSGKPVLRRRLATALRDKVVEVTDERRHKQVPDEDGDMVQRKKLAAFSLLMLNVGCELTDIEEWMWGWLGYVVKDLETPPAAAVPAPAVDAAS